MPEARDHDTIFSMFSLSFALGVRGLWTACTSKIESPWNGRFDLPLPQHGAVDTALSDRPAFGC